MLALVRATRLILHIAAGLLIAAAMVLDRRHWLKPEQMTHWWNSVLLDILNIRFSIRGTPACGARMSVANHVSWLDIPLIAASEPTRFVSKSEVRHWPVAGWLADAAGTFYIRRGKGGARPLLDKLTPHLTQGGSIVIFPEGTTTDGSQVLDFHPRLFAAAIAARCPVQPIAIRYGRGHDGADIAPFIGSDDLVSHLWRLLQEPELSAELIYCAPLCGNERDALAQLSRESVCAALSAAPASVIAEAPALQAFAA